MSLKRREFSNSFEFQSSYNSYVFFSFEFFQSISHHNVYSLIDQFSYFNMKFQNTLFSSFIKYTSYQIFEQNSRSFELYAQSYEVNRIKKKFSVDRIRKKFFDSIFSDQFSFDFFRIQRSKSDFSKKFKSMNINFTVSQKHYITIMNATREYRKLITTMISNSAIMINQLANFRKTNQLNFRILALLKKTELNHDQIETQYETINLDLNHLFSRLKKKSYRNE